jgi:hypothetical protein
MLRTNDGTGDFFQVSDEPTPAGKKQPDNKTASSQDSSWSKFWKSLLTYSGIGLGFILFCFRLSNRRK